MTSRLCRIGAEILAGIGPDPDETRTKVSRTTVFDEDLAVDKCCPDDSQSRVRLGRGGNGTVYGCTELSDVAIKKAKKDQYGDVDDVTEEVDLLNMLNKRVFQENIAKACPQKGRYVMKKFVEGDGYHLVHRYMQSKKDYDKLGAAVVKLVDDTTTVSIGPVILDATPVNFFYHVKNKELVAIDTDDYFTRMHSSLTQEGSLQRFKTIYAFYICMLWAKYGSRDEDALAALVLGNIDGIEDWVDINGTFYEFKEKLATEMQFLRASLNLDRDRGQMDTLTTHYNIFNPRKNSMDPSMDTQLGDLYDKLFAMPVALPSPSSSPMLVYSGAQDPYALLEDSDESPILPYNWND